MTAYSPGSEGGEKSRRERKGNNLKSSRENVGKGFFNNH
jgi:hypothetical protein